MDLTSTVPGLMYATPRFADMSFHPPAQTLSLILYITKAMPGLKPARYHPPVDDCGDRFDAADVVFRTIEIVAVDDDEIGELAGLNGAASLFSELKIRRPDRPHLECFLPRNLLLRVDHFAFARPACDRRPHVEERVEGVYRRIF